MRFFTLFIGFWVWPALAMAQGWGTIAGSVQDAQTRIALPSVTVLIHGTNFGTATDADGAYTLRIPVGRYAVQFSFVGYETRVDSVVVEKDQMAQLSVRLKEIPFTLDEMTVEDTADAEEVGVFQLTPEEIQQIPAPFRDGFRALKVVPGVAANNELSNEYSVRGGGYNENLIFINGFEIYKPFRARKGEQEGLGLLNPDLAENITFYTGGFPVRYGGKLSSALDVSYYQPERESLHGTAYGSLLDAGVSLRGSTGRLGWAVGARKARPRRFFATQETQGAYDPDYTDLQATLAFRVHPNHELSALGLWARHRFLLEPTQRRTTFGTLNNLRSVWINFAGEETDGYESQFAGLRLRSYLRPNLRAEHDIAYFGTVENERFDISGDATLFFIKDPLQSDPNTGEGFIPTGSIRQFDTANNRVRVNTLTAQSRWFWTKGLHALEVGGFVRRLTFDDQLLEESAVEGRSETGDLVRVTLEALGDSATFSATQVGAYAQDAVSLLEDRLILTGGLRLDHFSFNQETTLAPRLSARYHAEENLTLTGSWGVYYQAPTYREFRGQPEAEQDILGALNRNLNAQRSLQFVAGATYFLPKYRLFLRGEAYYKRLHNLISYDLENVRVRYSGENDSEGYAYGLDLQVRGELVPGLESWVNYSFLVARERFLPAFVDAYTTGSIRRPTDQRHTFSMFVQDYIPGDQTWKIHMRLLFGSGFPYTPPVPDVTVGGITLQVPGPRNTEGYPAYRRLDMGATRVLNLASGPHPLRLELTAEVLNVFGVVNTVDYSWIGVQWQRVPTHLTPRTLNVRARFQF